MIEVTLYGRGGQGAVVGSRVLAYAAVVEGKYGQQAQSPVGERRGAPVWGWVRIDDKKIRIRAPIVSPDYLIVLDPTIVYTENIEAGLKDNSTIILNSPKNLELKHKTICVDATSIALKHLGRPVVNTSLLGAFSALTGIVSLASIEKVLPDLLGRKLVGEEHTESNIAALRETYEEVKRKCQN
ncbi:MAG: 2-oxoacid:acceptor oxidoreductase family protein [Syntrophales bacterium]|nr:2-oxoacid:acceptor oxidoreductase family protein [Syntrophales bacterium]